jgi:hypothetical protein
MSDQPEFPKPAAEVAATLAELLKHQGESQLADLVSTAIPEITLDHVDTWDGTTWYCTLHLEVSTSLFAAIEAKLEKTEQGLATKLKKLFRNTSPYVLTDVTISARAGTVSMQRTTPTPDEINRIWEPETLRLFLTHVSAHKEAVTQMKNSLLNYGISGFVAHEDIEPNLEWQNEIELALGSMHALCALLTPEFHQSNWTDQEVGFALGRNVPVLSIRLGMSPYGFIGKNQGLRGNLNSLHPTAGAIAEILLKESRTKIVMRDSLVAALERAKTFATAKQVATMLATVTGFSPAQLERLRTACSENSQVSGSWGVPEIISNLT